MAAYHAEFLCDLAKPPRVIALPHAFVAGDHRSFTLTALVFDSEDPGRGLLPGSVAGAAVTPSGGTVPLTGEKGIRDITLPSGGTVPATTCSVTLIRGCFPCAGQILIVIRLVDGESETTVLLARGHVAAGLTDTVVDPGAAVPDITVLLAKIGDCASAAEAAYRAAQAADTAAETAGQTAADAVLTAPQSLDAGRQARARANIGAACGTDVLSAALRGTAAGNPAVAADAAEGAPVRVTVTFGPEQDGSGVPSPENPRPIRAAERVTLTRTGANLFDGAVESGVINITTGQDMADASRYRCRGYIPVVPGARYWFRPSDFAVSSSPRIPTRLYFYDRDRNFLAANVTVSAPAAVTMPENCRFLRFFVNTPIANADGTIRIFHPAAEAADPGFRGVTAEAAFPEAAGAVCGGTVTLNPDGSGELAAAWGLIPAYAGESLPGTWLSDRDAYAPGTLPSAGAQVAWQYPEPRIFPLTGPRLTTLGGANCFTGGEGTLTVTYVRDAAAALAGLEARLAALEGSA